MKVSTQSNSVKVRPQSAVKRFRCPTCGAKRGQRCEGGRIHISRRSK